MAVGSLRRRLTAVCLAVLLLAIAGFDVFLYASFDSRLTRDLDQQLVDRAGLAKLLDGELPAQQLADRLAGGGVTATVRHDGTTYSGQPKRPPRAPAAGPPAAPRPPQGTATDVVRSGSRLTLTETLTDGTLVLTTDRSQIDADLNRLLALELVGSAIVLGAAALALVLLVGRAVAPLDEMTRVASDIAGGQSGRRLDPTRTDTELGRMAGAFDAMLDSLEDAAGRAQRSEERMRDFLSDISHELRTPIAGLIATAETLIREGAVTDPADEQRLVAIVRQSGRAGRLIDDLLTLSRLEHGDDLRHEPCDLKRLVDEEAERARMLAPTLQISVDGPRRLAIVGDGDRLGQVVANLLDNARHATPDGGTIAIAIERVAETARIEVTDTGRGVPDAERERIFERLVRLDPSRSRERFGGGLGLSIARTIARAHGGELRCVAHRGGARFVLALPAERGDAHAAGDAGLAAAVGR